MLTALAAVTLASSLRFQILLLQTYPTIVATCDSQPVAYRFIGKAGQEFRYAGHRYTIPREGSMELISAKNWSTYHHRGHDLPLGRGPLDPFGIREVSLPVD